MPKSDTYERDGLGTRWWIELLGGQKYTDRLRRIIDVAMDEFVANYSRFDERSWVGRLNEHKNITGFPDEMYDMFVFAQQMCTASYGAFNISVGGTLHRLGYGAGRHSAATVSDFWQRSALTRSGITIPEDAVVDLGGFGKGWLIDRLGDLLDESGIDQYIVNGGGDILVKSNEPVELALEHPLYAGRVIGRTRITHGALAVSSSVKRAWQRDGETHHHIIDPTVDRSADSGVISTYIRANTALVADTLATILLLRPELEKELSHAYDAQTILLRADQVN